MEEIIASGKADVVELARAVIADPDLPNKIRTGRESEVRPCLRCLNCFSVLLPTGFYVCAVNPEQGHDEELRYETTRPVKQRVLVVGGGPAGMQAALGCAQRGHDVILCEKSDRLGGILRCERDVPFKWRVDRYLNYMERQVGKAGIELRLNTDVTPAYAKAQAVDVVIAAVGAAQTLPAIPGIGGANVVSAVDAYEDAARVGESVVIPGGGLVGTELAIHLVMRGRSVDVVEMLGEISHGGNALHIKAIDNEIRRRGVRLHFYTKAVEIAGNRVVCEDVKTGEKRIFDAETVVFALGMTPLQEEAAAFYDCAPQFHMIGDCKDARNLMAAVNDAFYVARDVGRFF
jgi:NADPH-dependent 2,4-dienoyl-CoA reductase/sulfur reductase-like enzyme